jgi:hypothetical protein
MRPLPASRQTLSCSDGIVQPVFSPLKTDAILYSIDFGDPLRQTDLRDNSISLDAASGGGYTLRFGEWISQC